MSHQRSFGLEPHNPLAAAADRSRQWLCQAGTDDGTIYSHLCLAGSKQVNLSDLGWECSFPSVLGLHLGTRKKVHNVSLFTYWIIWSCTWPPRVEFNEFLCWKYVCGWKEWSWVQFSIERACVKLKSEFVCLYKHVQTSLHKLISITYSKTPPPTVNSTGWINTYTSHLCALYSLMGPIDLYLLIYFTAKPLHLLYSCVL